MMPQSLPIALTPADFAARRQKLIAALPQDAVVVIASAPEKIRSRDTDYPYRQDSDFYYLTGFEEPDAVLVLRAGDETSQQFFCRPRDRAREIWDGYRLGPEGAEQVMGLSPALPINELDARLPQLIAGARQVFYALGQSPVWEQRVMGLINQLRSQSRSGVKAPEALCDLGPLLHEQRLLKSPAEIDLMRASAAIAMDAHRRAMRTCRPGLWEYQLEAEILHHFAMAGARHPAYNTIVGGGANACVLHYIQNNQPLIAGDLVLIDAGCEYGYYASDITRTFPVSGRFNPQQAALYDLVIAAQQAAIAVIRPGTPWNQPHDESVRVLTQGLVDLGLLCGEVETLIATEAYKRFYMHRVGHWLGMDVHDVGAYKTHGQWRPLQAGMVMTVEPGLYVAADDDSVGPEWRGIGIRVEDDVLVTDAGCELLTAGLIRTRAEIEAYMAAPA